MLAAAERAAQDHGFSGLAAAHKPLTVAQINGLLERGPARIAAAASTTPLSAAEVGDALFQDRLVVHYKPIVD